MRNAYTTRIVFVKPDPDFHPVTTMTGSPDLINPRAFPKRAPNCTRSSTSFIQSLWADSSEIGIENCFLLLFMKTLLIENGLDKNL